jgi:hypothetical protein
MRATSSNRWIQDCLGKGEKIDPFDKRHKYQSGRASIQDLEKLKEAGVLSSLDFEWLKWKRTLEPEERKKLHQIGCTTPNPEEIPESCGFEFDYMEAEPPPNQDHSSILSAMALLVGEIFQPGDKDFQLPVNRFLGLLYLLRQERCEELGGFRAMGKASSSSFQSVYKQARRWEERLGKPCGHTGRRKTITTRTPTRKKGIPTDDEKGGSTQQVLPFFEGEPGYYPKTNGG